MIAQTFFKLFPPPKFLNIPCAGLDISDDAVRCIEYSSSGTHLSIHRYGTRPLAPGVVLGGEIKNTEALTKAISSLSRELKVYVVNASLPEEKMYLFKTEVPATSMRSKEIRQNIEFKLEENVPVSPGESLFFFDVIPSGTGIAVGEGGKLVSVSVAPRSLILSYLEAIQAAGVTVLSFEVQAKAIARALVSASSTETQMIVYIMDKKTGIYIVCGGVVCFTSTISWGNKTGNSGEELRKPLKQILDYWEDHGLGTNISRLIFAGRGALTDGLTSQCYSLFTDLKVVIETGNVWQNAFSHDRYIPPVLYEDSLDYAVAAGLALPPFII